MEEDQFLTIVLPISSRQSVFHGFVRFQVGLFSIYRLSERTITPRAALSTAETLRVPPIVLSIFDMLNRPRAGSQSQIMAILDFDIFS